MLENDVYNFLKNNQTYIYIGLFILLIILSIAIKCDFTLNDTNETLNSQEVNISTIEKNYQLKAYKEYKEEITTIKREEANNLTTYEVEGNDYIISKNRVYYVNDDKTLTLTTYDRIKEDKYLNQELINALLGKCTFIDNKCNININTYLELYNNIYNTIYITKEDTNIVILNIPSSEKVILTVDLTEINKIINNDENELKYRLEYYNIGKLNYSEILEYYKELE